MVLELESRTRHGEASGEGGDNSKVRCHRMGRWVVMHHEEERHASEDGSWIGDACMCWWLLCFSFTGHHLYPSSLLFGVLIASHLDQRPPGELGLAGFLPPFSSYASVVSLTTIQEDLFDQQKDRW